MWIPRPVYEALPALYVATGAAMILLLVYLAEVSLQAILYGGIAVACLVAGPVVHRTRASARQNADEAIRSDDVDHSPQTGNS